MALAMQEPPPPPPPPPPEFDGEADVVWAGEPEEEQQAEGVVPLPNVNGHVGFLEAAFSAFDGKLGIVLDWSMPYPVVARIIPGSPAASRSQLSPGLVLIAINKNGIRLREPKEEVERRLLARPLHLVLEAPAPERFDFFGTMKTWKKHLNKARGSKPTTPMPNTSKPATPMLNISRSTTPLPATPMTGFSLTAQSFFERHPDRQFGDQQALMPLPPPASNLRHALDRVKSSPGPLNSIDDMHGSRVADIRKLYSPTKLPPVIRGGFAATAASLVESRNRTRAGGVSWAGAAAAAAAATPLRQAVSSKSLTWLATATPRPDAAYQHLVDDPQTVGPGPPERWPLHHDDMYLCRLADMMLAWRTREAYEVGFRGKKFERITQMHLTCAKEAPVLEKRVARIDEVYCDMCGVDIVIDKDPDRDKPRQMLLHPEVAKHMEAVKAEAQAKKAKMITFDEKPVLAGALAAQTQGAFYFCRRCKRNGNRFEICAACHAIEVIQSEGKHHGKELHPHFLRCQHRSLVRRRFVNDVCPGMPHIRRVMCDYCGHLAGSFSEDNEVWICERCPQEHGLRFEMCVPCYSSMMTVSEGVNRIDMLSAIL